MTVSTLASPLKKGDNVVVTAGKDKGKTGKVLKVITKKNRILVEGANMVKRHVKAGMNQEPGIISKEMSLHVSNVMIADPKDGKPTRIGYKTEGDKKVRFAKKSGEVIDK